MDMETDKEMALKLVFGEQVRRLRISTDSTFSQLLKTISELFMMEEKQVELSYIDDEQDKVEVKNDSDLQAALFFFRYSDLIKFNVHSTSQQQQSTQSQTPTSENKAPENTQEQQETKPSEEKTTQEKIAGLIGKVLSQPEMASNPFAAIGSVLADEQFISEARSTLQDFQRDFQQQQQWGGMGGMDFARMASLFGAFNAQQSSSTPSQSSPFFNPSTTGCGANTASTSGSGGCCGAAGGFGGNEAMMNGLAGLFGQFVGQQPPPFQQQPPPPPQQQTASKWERELEMLREMGFGEVERNVQLLNKHNGDLDLVVADLFSQQ